MLRSIFRRLQTNARKYSCLSSKREWEKTGGKSVLSFLDIAPTLSALLTLHNFCFRASRRSVSDIETIRLLSGGCSLPNGATVRSHRPKERLYRNFGSKVTLFLRNREKTKFFFISFVNFGRNTHITLSISPKIRINLAKSMQKTVRFRPRSLSTPRKMLYFFSLSTLRL